MSSIVIECINESDRYINAFCFECILKLHDISTPLSYNYNQT